MLDPETFAAIIQRGRAALAWEVLRRDPAYREDYARLPAPADGGSAAGLDLAARWGLHFR